MNRSFVSSLVVLGSLLLASNPSISSNHSFCTENTAGATELLLTASPTREDSSIDEEEDRAVEDRAKDEALPDPHSPRILYERGVQYSAEGRPLDPTRPMIVVDPRVYRVNNEAEGDHNEENSEETPDAASSEEESTTDPNSDSNDVEDSHQAVVLTPEMAERCSKIQECLDSYSQQYENSRQRSPWGIMHTLITHGVDTEIEAGGRGGRRVNAIGWLCWNEPCAGQRLFTTTRDGQLIARTGDGLQGHKGQFLAMLAQSRVPKDYPILVNGHEFTVADLIEHEKRTCYPRTELTFKLIALSYYLDSDETWLNDRNREWSMERLIREELAQNVIGAACGGTHRMMGFSYAVRMREKRGEPFTGEWDRAREFVEAYHEYTFKLQNADGSFSTNWFASRGASRSIDRRMQTSGHILEWLVYSLPEEDLDDPRVTLAVDYLTHLMTANRNRTWEIGPKGHALHALVLYNRRIQKASTSTNTQLVQQDEISLETEQVAP